MHGSGLLRLQRPRGIWLLVGPLAPSPAAASRHGPDRLFLSSKRWGLSRCIHCPSSAGPEQILFMAGLVGELTATVGDCYGLWEHCDHPGVWAVCAEACHPWQALGVNSSSAFT